MDHDARHPRWVYGAGDEPDPRFSLANERTFLAWARTALGLLAGAVAAHHFVEPDRAWLRGLLVGTLVVVAGACTVMSLLRWARVERAMRLRRPLPGFITGYVLAAGLVLACVLVPLALAL